MDEERKLSDADIDAIVDALEQRVAANLYTNLGQGMVGMLKKVLMFCFGGVILYGMSKGIKP